MFGFKHERTQSGMFHLKAHVGAGQLRQARAEILPTMLHRAAESFLHALETADGEAVQQSLFVGKMPKRGRVADAQFPAQLA